MDLPNTDTTFPTADIIYPSPSICRLDCYDLGKCFFAFFSVENVVNFLTKILLRCCHEPKNRSHQESWAPGLVNFIPALAYHFCLALPAKFSQPGVHSNMVTPVRPACFFPALDTLSWFFPQKLSYVSQQFP